MEFTYRESAIPLTIWKRYHLKPVVSLVLAPQIDTLPGTYMYANRLPTVTVSQSSQYPSIQKLELTTVSVTNGVGVQPLVGMPLGGIALDNAGMELVKLRDNTGRRAVRPSHFISLLVFMASQ
jgi:hypothetical protein